MFSALQRAIDRLQTTHPDSSEYQPVISPGSALLSETADGPPSDDYNSTREVGEYDRVKVYISFWVLGAGVLMSWNALICTYPLLISYIPSDHPLRGSLSSTLSTVFCFGNLAFLGYAQRHVGTASPSKRLHSSLTLLLVSSMILTFPALPIVLPQFSPTLLLISLIIVSLVLSFATAFLQSAVFALSSLWGSEQTLAVMSGQGGIAVLVSSIQFILAFASAIGKSSNDAVAGEDASKLAGVGLWAACSLGVAGCFLASSYLKRHRRYHEVVTPKSIRHVAEEGDETHGEQKGLTRDIMRRNWDLNLAVALVFVVTLSVFPAVTTRILSTHSPTPRLLQPDIFLPLHFVVFNIGDYVGRTYLPSTASLLVTSPRRILLFSVLRVLFIPFFFACNVLPRAAGNAPTINSDFVYLLIVLFFAVTNGYLGSLCMIVASSPSLNPRIKDQERDVAATLASFCLVAGLAGGSLASFAVSWAVDKGL